MLNLLRFFARPGDTRSLHDKLPSKSFRAGVARRPNGPMQNAGVSLRQNQLQKIRVAVAISKYGANLTLKESICESKAQSNMQILRLCCVDFGGEMLTLGPLQELADLNEVNLDNQFDSIKLINSLKVFERSSE
jgi:hypothetical protein